MKISQVSEMRAMDRAAIEQYGITEALLMENAGHAAYTVLLQEVGLTGKRFLVFCGLGNNGADGFVVARKIHSGGGTVQVYIVGDREAYKGAAKLHLDILARLPVPIHQLTAVALAQPEIARCDVIIDALFGTGLSRQITGLHREVIEAINGSGKAVLSLDIPSGVQGDTGQVMGTAVRAQYTVTFGLPKPGNLLYPGYELGGRLYVSHISFPPALYNADTLKIALNQPIALPPRNPQGHKGTFGDVLFIAGAASYFGAPAFAAMSFLKAGGGYSRLAAPASMIPFLATRGGEIVFVPQQETSARSLALSNKPALLELAARADMVVLGPGLSLHEETQQLARELMQEIETPLLIDGDGLTALSKERTILTQRRAPTILTPHLGEMSRLTALPVPDIDTRKIDILRQTATELQAIIVLKGAHSLIGHPDARVYINLSGNSGMATAGSGDVLTGTIAAMFGLGLALPEAVQKGVFLHGLAGDLAALDKGEDGLTAQDLLDYLPYAVQLDRQGLPDTLRERYVGARIV
jgi:ADP-dependent NAD(P)H-hydrate dehydratase / NAD(P)H-hydrate epimerase